MVALRIPPLLTAHVRCGHAVGVSAACEAQAGRMSMMSRLGSHPSRAWLGAFALVSLAYAAGGCGSGPAKPAVDAARTAATPADGRDAPNAPARVRDGPAGGRAGRHVRAVHRRPRRDGQAPAGPGRRDVQSHVLLRRQGRAARHGVRVRAAHRGAAQQAAQDRRTRRRSTSSSCRCRATCCCRRSSTARSTWSRRRSPVTARAAEARRLHQSHPDERQRGPGHRPRRAGDRPRSTTCPARKSSSASEQLLREPASRSTRS